MRASRIFSRRGFLSAGMLSAAGMLTAGCAGSQVGHTGEAGESEEKPITPAEDLMREHGLLVRALLILQDTSRRLNANEDVPLDPFRSTVDFIRHFVEDYHEWMEEQYVFPRMRRAPKLVDLVDLLQKQHGAGRAVIYAVTQATANGLPGTAAGRKTLASLLASYQRMYYPHLAREDTVVFREFHQMLPADEYAELGEKFEDTEHRRVGPHGFESALDQLVAAEKAFGLYDLAQFTPAIARAQT